MEKIRVFDKDGGKLISKGKLRGKTSSSFFFNPRLVGKDPSEPTQVGKRKLMSWKRRVRTSDKDRLYMWEEWHAREE